MGGKASAASFLTQHDGEIAVLATLWEGTLSAVKLAAGQTDSRGKTVQRPLPDAQMIKAFNVVCNAHTFRQDFPANRRSCSYVEMTSA